MNIVFSQHLRQFIPFVLTILQLIQVLHNSSSTRFSSFFHLSQSPFVLPTLTRVSLFTSLQPLSTTRISFPYVTLAIPCPLIPPCKSHSFLNSLIQITIPLIFHLSLFSTSSHSFVIDFDASFFSFFLRVLLQGCEVFHDDDDDSQNTYTYIYTTYIGCNCFARLQ